MNDITAIAAAGDERKGTIDTLDHVLPDGAIKADNGEVVIESAYAGLSRKQTLRVCWKPVLWVALACVCALNDGYEYSIPNAVINNQSFIDLMGKIDPNTGIAAIPPKTVSLWSGCGQALVTVGQVTGGLVSDRFGRKGSMYLLTLFFIIGAILSITAKEWKEWLAGRLTFGFGMGLTQVTITTYVSEIAPTQIRGTMLALYSLAFAFGQFFSSICLQIIAVNYPTKWRVACYTQWIFIGLWVIIVPFVPESPWHLARKHDHEKAKRSLLKLNKGTKGYDVEREYLVLQTEIAHAEALSAGGRAAFLEIFKGTNGRRTIASTIGPTMQIIVGVPIFFSYITYFFAQCGIKDPFQATIIMYCIYITALIISFWTTELVGRRPLLLGGAFVMFFANMGLGLSGTFKITNSALNAALACSCIWMFVYSLTSGPVAFVVSGETSTPRLRAPTNSFAIWCYGSLSLIFTFVVPYMLDVDRANWGVKSGYLFAGGCFISFLAVYFFVPETAGRTFAELDELWETGIPVRKFKQAETRAERMGAFDRPQFDASTSI